MAEWVCYKDGCECEHEWVFTLVFALTITGHRTRAIICDKCRHPRRPIMEQSEPARMRRWDQIAGWAVSVALTVAVVTVAVWFAYTR